MRYDVPVRMSEGRLMHIDFQLSPMRDEDGRIIGSEVAVGRGELDLARRVGGSSGDGGSLNDAVPVGCNSGPAAPQSPGC